MRSHAEAGNRPEEVRAIVTRADGTVHNLGVICAYYPGLRGFWWDHFGKRMADRRISRANRYAAAVAAKE